MSKEILFLAKRVKLIFFLYVNPRPPNCSELSRKCDITVSHLVKTLNDFQGMKIIEKHRNGRNIEIHLTEKGKRIALELAKIFKSLELSIYDT